MPHAGDDDPGNHTKEAPMFDFTDGTTWFIAGLSTTVAVVLVLLAVIGIARLTERHRLPATRA